MPLPKMVGTLASLDGCLYAVGGRDAENNPLASVEKFNTSSREWVKVAEMETPRADLKVLVDPYNPGTGKYDDGGCLLAFSSSCDIVECMFMVHGVLNCRPMDP